MLLYYPDTEEPQYNEPLYNEGPGIMNDILQPRQSYSKILLKVDLLLHLQLP